jgi:hypothetical protein
VAELSRADVALLGEPAPTWQYFWEPDGNVYTLVAD